MHELCFVAVVSWLKRSVIASGQGGKPVRTQSEWSFVGQTPAELCLLLLKWLTCTSNLTGLPTPQSLGHPSWHCSVYLAPVLHCPSCKGYNSCLCLGQANTTWLQNCENCIDCLCQGVKYRSFVKGRQCGFVLAGEFEVMCAKCV